MVILHLLDTRSTIFTMIILTPPSTRLHGGYIDPFTDHEIKRKISLFRELDSMIDFSKSSYQLDIVIFIGNVGKPVSVDAIVSALGVDRKQVLDALRKLKIKGIVTANNNFYMLTNTGKRFYDLLVKNIANHDNGNDSGSDSESIIRIIRRFRGIGVSMDIIKLLGIWGRPLRLDKIAKRFGVSVPELLELLSPFTRSTGGEDIIRLVDCKGKFSRKTTKCLSLSRIGLDIARTLPGVRRYRIPYRIIGSLTFTEDLDDAVERIMIYIAGILISMLLLQRTPYGKEAMVVGFASIMFFIFLYMFSRKISKIFNRSKII
ncbi:MAG: hypothetical protein QXX84_01020 [Sulfolobales archaeon]|jgi:biotin operon repressor